MHKTITKYLSEQQQQQQNIISPRKVDYMDLQHHCTLLVTNFLGILFTNRSHSISPLSICLDLIKYKTQTCATNSQLQGSCVKTKTSIFL